METSTSLRPKKELHFQTFFLALGMAILVFLPFVIKDRGYFVFYGDFNAQQIPFYRMCHDAVRNGEIFWNWNTDLGVNFIGSYSFYLLGSPFFWLTLPFPSEVVPYLMAPLLVLKFALAAFTAYFYIRRFTHTPKAAMLASLLYAFSGFSVYNIFFNHFHEAIIFFPLLLLGLELYITEKRRGVFALCVFICALSNYFFFFGMVVFTVIYWIIRTAGRCYKQSFGSFILMFFESVLGVAMASAILLPTFFAVIQNSRLSSISYGWNAITYGKEQIYLNILQCFFFPPDIPARPVFFPGADVKWSSLGGWLPLFGMTGVIAFWQAKKGHWARRVIGVCGFMALVPILNSAFYMFNSAYYARWFFMPILIMCLMTAQAIDDRKVEWNSAWRWSFFITLAASLVIGLFPSNVENGKIKQLGLFTNPTERLYIFRFIVTCLIAIGSLVILRLLIGMMRKKREQFFTAAMCLVCTVSVCYSIFFIASGKQHSHTSDIMIDQLIEGKIDLGQDDETFRVDVYDSVDNTGMYLGLYSINAFHSIVPGSVTEFYEYVGEERGVASRPTTKTPAIRSLLSVKYLISDAITGDSFTDENGTTKMPGYSYYKSENDFEIYTNENYIPLGFVYDYYMSSDICERFGNSYRDDMMLKAILLSDEQVEKYKSILPPVDCSEEFNNIYKYDEGYDYSVDEYYFGGEMVAKDCARFASRAAYDFKRDRKGFTCSINLDAPNLVFFSVPYEEGWTAYVNGEKAEIERVNVGFMAVKANSGVNEIKFVYTAPGLVLGVKISVAAIAVWIIYTVAAFFIRKKHSTLPVYPEGAQLRELWETYDKEDEEELRRLDMETDRYFGTDADKNEGEFSQKYRTALGGFDIDDSFFDDISEEKTEPADTDSEDEPTPDDEGSEPDTSADTEGNTIAESSDFIFGDESDDEFTIIDEPEDEE